MQSSIKVKAHHQIHVASAYHVTFTTTIRFIVDGRTDRQWARDVASRLRHCALRSLPPMHLVRSVVEEGCSERLNPHTRVVHLHDRHAKNLMFFSTRKKIKRLSDIDTCPGMALLLSSFRPSIRLLLLNMFAQNY